MGVGIDFTPLFHSAPLSRIPSHKPQVSLFLGIDPDRSVPSFAPPNYPKTPPILKVYKPFHRTVNPPNNRDVLEYYLKLMKSMRWTMKIAAKTAANIAKMTAKIAKMTATAMIMNIVRREDSEEE